MYPFPSLARHSPHVDAHGRLARQAVVGGQCADSEPAHGRKLGDVRGHSHDQTNVNERFLLADSFPTAQLKSPARQQRTKTKLLEDQTILNYDLLRLGAEIGLGLAKFHVYRYRYLKAFFKFCEPAGLIDICGYGTVNVGHGRTQHVHGACEADTGQRAAVAVPAGDRSTARRDRQCCNRAATMTLPHVCSSKNASTLQTFPVLRSLEAG